MTHPIAYVMAGSLNADTEARVEAGLLPRRDYHEFLARNHADLLTSGHIPYGRSPLVKFWSRVNHERFALASLIIERAGTYSAIVCAGEEVGIAIAFGLHFTRARIPIYILTRGSYIGSSKFRVAAALLKRMRRLRYLTVSNSIRANLIGKCGIPESQAINTGFGIDTDYFRPLSIRAEANLIVSAGCANRDYQTLIAAVRPLDVRLVIACDGTKAQAISGQFADLPKNVELRDYFDADDLRGLYARASLVVAPLHAGDGASGYAAIAEAMAMGKPVVSTRTEGLCDYMVDRETGYLVGPESVDELRTRIVTLLEHPALAAKMGSVARTRIAIDDSLNAHCSRIEAAMGLNPTGIRL